MELTAITEENNAKFVDLNKNIDELREENSKLHQVMHDQIATSTEMTSSTESSLQNNQNVNYLLNELETNAVAFADNLVISYAYV